MLTNCHCLKCGYNWFSTKLYFGIPPKTCPSCHRYDWAKPRVRARRGSRKV